MRLLFSRQASLVMEGERLSVTEYGRLLVLLLVESTLLEDMLVCSPFRPTEIGEGG